MDDAFRAADLFMLKQGRLVERRLFATCFLKASPSGVVNALRGYQNDDGGFGHGLEPDKRCPASLPIDVEIAEALVFLENVPDRERADRCAAELASYFDAVPGLHLDPDAEGYGLSPLQFAPEAGSRWRSLFTVEQIDSHLDRLEREQAADGGWTITWEPPSEASALEWRAMVTIDALRTLTSYGRLVSY